MHRYLKNGNRITFYVINKIQFRYYMISLPRISFVYNQNFGFCRKLRPGLDREFSIPLLLTEEREKEARKRRMEIPKGIRAA